MKQLLALFLLSSPSFAAVPNTTQFGLDLYRELSKKPGNLFLSPYSISTALAMTSAGAKGRTLEEMLTTLHLEKDPHPGMEELRKALASDEKDKPTLATANHLWAQTGAPYRSEFLELTRKTYGAGLTPLAFKTDPEGSRKMINTWVEEQTRHKIKDLMPSGSVTSSTDLVLTNAIYFKGDWEKAFEKGDTKEEDFHPAKGKTSKQPFLHSNARTEYAEDNSFQAVRLPYKGGELAMTIYLPKKGKSLSSLTGSINEKLFEKFRSNFSRREVKLGFPKFRLEHEERLHGLLPRLGMKQAFLPSADFSGMRPVGKDEAFYISAVIHKAFVEVDEKGTEAAAATGVSMVFASAVVHEDPPKVFQADRPFLFTIEHMMTGTVLFLGRVEGL